MNITQPRSLAIPEELKSLNKTLDDIITYNGKSAQSRYYGTSIQELNGLKNRLNELNNLDFHSQYGIQYRNYLTETKSKLATVIDIVSGGIK